MFLIVGVIHLLFIVYLYMVYGSSQKYDFVQYNPVSNVNHPVEGSGSM